MKTRVLQVHAAFVTAFIGTAVTGLATTDAHAALGDELRLSHLEQDVRELQNQVLRQSRRIDTLESAVPRASVPTSPRAPGTAIAKSPQANTAWLNSANWDKLSPGMSDAKVVSVLGPPTTLRASEQGGTQTLFYSLELEAGGFLSGRVVIADHRVVEIHQPELR